MRPIKEVTWIDPVHSSLHLLGFSPPAYFSIFPSNHAVIRYKILFRLFDLHVTVHRVKFLILKPTRCTNFSNLFLEWNSTCFGQFLCPSSGVFHCTHSNGICHTGLLTTCEQNARKLLENLYYIYHCYVYSEKLLMMDRGTVRNM